MHAEGFANLAIQMPWKVLPLCFYSVLVFALCVAAIDSGNADLGRDGRELTGGTGSVRVQGQPVDCREARDDSLDAVAGANEV